MNDAIFFSTVRARLFGGRLTDEQFKGLSALLAQWKAHFLATTSLTQFAYCLATAFHETGGKMVPVSENLSYSSGDRIKKTWPSRFASAAAAAPYARNPQALANKVYNGRMGNALGSNDGWNYRGRSLVQLTGKDNYAKATTKLRALGLLQAHEDLVADPDLALRDTIAVALLIVGMEEGWFTGVTLDRTIDDAIDGDEVRDFTDGRRIINGTDKAAKIAGDAMNFLAALQAAGAGSLKAPASAPVSAVPAPAAAEPHVSASLPSVAVPVDSGGIPALEAYPAKPPSGWVWLDRLRAAFPRKG